MWTEIEKKEEPSLINSDEEIDEFEGRHGVNLPEDHRQFLKEFGQGVIFNYIRIWGIEKINSEYKEFQTRWSEYFLWEDPNSQLSEDELKNCIIIADSFNGDELVISPKHKNYIFYLPQDSENISDLGASLEEAVKKIIANQKREVEGYPEEEQEEWNLVPEFMVSCF